MSSYINRREFLRMSLGSMALAKLPRILHAADNLLVAAGGKRTNVVLCMTDDQGWGDTSYNGHPYLKTPNLDAMAANGLRFDRFYAAAPVCSPTRASCLTGRHPHRSGVTNHGVPMALQERTIAQVLRDVGYATGHFGKWHLEGKKGPGVPVQADDPRNPSAFGFDEWVSASNYFDLDPELGRKGVQERFKGDTSDIIMAEAIAFIRRQHAAGKPFLAVIWFPSPHWPHKALREDKAPYKDRKDPDFCGEMVGVDRAMGVLRMELRKLGIANNTLVWFTSDNGGYPDEIHQRGLRGGKFDLWEGGIRVPGIIEWPARISKGFSTTVPAVTSDILPTLIDVLDIKNPKLILPQDGISLAALIDGKMQVRPQPIGFWYKDWRVWMDGELKLHVRREDKDRKQVIELYDLDKDPAETTNLAAKRPEIVARMIKELDDWTESVKRSQTGKDYAE